VHANTVIIGAGHAGLAMSRRLTERSIDHVVLERGRVANSWDTERWDSLRLLTPNWQTRLPGSVYDGADANGFMTMPEVTDFIRRYAKMIDAPIEEQTTVTSLRAIEHGYEAITNQGRWTCDSVVVAAGPANIANIPAMDERVPETVETYNPMTYRNAGGLREGGVLIVGGSATGAQLAAEIRASGRPVTLSLGEHVRLPRSYRGQDIFWWMDKAGILDQRYDEIDDLVRGRNLPSPQLIGTPERSSINLNTLRDSGVSLVGRLGAIANGTAFFSGGLRNTCQLADLKLNRLLNTFDEWAGETGQQDINAPERFEPTVLDVLPTTSLDIQAAGIRTIVWATGYRPDYSWLQVDVLDRKGRIRHDGGVVRDAPGMYLLGTAVLRRRRSSFINGAAQDTAELSEHLHGFLDSRLASSTAPTRLAATAI